MPRTILVVDDEPDMIENCARLLRRIGQTCLRAQTGVEAIRLIDREPPDLVVTDLRLPGANGFAVARHARQRTPPIPVILITGYDSALARAMATRVGVAAYLSKPFLNAAFLNAVCHAIEVTAPGPSDASTL